MLFFAARSFRKAEIVKRVVLLALNFNAVNFNNFLIFIPAQIADIPMSVFIFAMQDITSGCTFRDFAEVKIDIKKIKANGGVIFDIVRSPKKVCVESFAAISPACALRVLFAEYCPGNINVGIGRSFEVSCKRNISPARKPACGAEYSFCQISIGKHYVRKTSVSKLPCVQAARQNGIFNNGIRNISRNVLSTKETISVNLGPFEMYILEYCLLYISEKHRKIKKVKISYFCVRNRRKIKVQGYNASRIPKFVRFWCQIYTIKKCSRCFAFNHCVLNKNGLLASKIETDKRFIGVVHERFKCISAASAIWKRDHLPCSCNSLACKSLSGDLVSLKGQNARQYGNCRGSSLEVPENLGLPNSALQLPSNGNPHWKVPLLRGRCRELNLQEKTTREQVAPRGGAA